MKSIESVSHSDVSNSAIPWTVAHQAPLSMGFSRQEYWSVQSVHSKGDQSWVFNGRTDAKAESPILWPPDANRKRSMSRLYIVTCLFNLYAEYIMRNAGLEEEQAGIKIAGRNINNLRYADNTTLMAESKEELKSFFTKVKEESESLA